MFSTRTNEPSLAEIQNHPAFREVVQDIQRKKEHAELERHAETAERARLKAQKDEMEAAKWHDLRERFEQKRQEFYALIVEVLNECGGQTNDRAFQSTNIPRLGTLPGQFTTVEELVLERQAQQAHLHAAENQRIQNASMFRDRI
jgi:hypothetical protein